MQTVYKCNMTEHSERYWEARWRDEKAENERLTTLADTRGLMLGQLRAQFDDMVRQRDRALEQAGVELSEENDRLIAENKRLTTDIASDQQRLFHYEAAIERMRADLNATQVSVMALDKESERLRAENTQLHEGMFRLRDQIERLTAERKALKDRIDRRLDNYLCEMKEGYDDSIVGFNEAWDIVRAVFAEGE
jgi:regulator of replication initiation timing